MVNQFDKFIEETDQELNVDTSMRTFSIEKHRRNSYRQSNSHMESSNISSPKSISRNSVISDSSSNGRPIIVQRQLTPVRINDLNDQPLKSPEQGKIGDNKTNASEPTSSPPLRNLGISSRNRSTSRSMINKRRSLIQPIIPHNEHSFELNNGVNKRHSHSSNKSIERKIVIEKPILTQVEPLVVQNSIDESNNSILSESNDVHELLKNLANKELELFESKQKIEELKKNLLYHEKMYEQQSNDLKLLKSKVSKHLSDNKSAINQISTPIKQPHPTDNSNNNEGYRSVEEQSTPERLLKINSNDLRMNSLTNRTSISPSPIKIKKRSPLPRDFIGERPFIDTQQHAAAVKLNSNEFSDSSTNDVRTATRDKKDSVWSKPFSIFNQFDQILQNELEKSLNWDNDTENDTSFVEDESNENNDNPREPITNIRSGAKTMKNISRINPPSIEETPGEYADIEHVNHDNNNNNNTRSVSSSLWGFVNDVKVGLMGTYENETYYRTDDDEEDKDDVMKEFNTTKKVVELQGLDSNGDINNNPRKIQLRNRRTNYNSRTQINESSEDENENDDEINRSVEMTFI